MVQFYSNCTVDLRVIELIWLYFLIKYFAFQLILVLLFRVRMQIPLLQIEASANYFSIHVVPLTALTPFANKPGVTDKLSAVTAVVLTHYFLVLLLLYAHAET